MSNNKGVSLAELSIVLIIISLLLAGVSQAIGMRKTAEIRGFVTDIKNFQVAIEGFDTRYRDLPGDMANALAIGVVLLVQLLALQVIVTVIVMVKLTLVLVQIVRHTGRGNILFFLNL